MSGAGRGETLKTASALSEGKERSVKWERKIKIKWGWLGWIQAKGFQIWGAEGGICTPYIEHRSDT